MSRRRSSLHLLETRGLSFECSVDVDALPGDGPARRCSQCDKDVTDLAALTRAEQRRLLAGVFEVPCVRVLRRADGTIIARGDADAPSRPFSLPKVVVAASLSALAACNDPPHTATAGEPALVSTPHVEVSAGTTEPSDGTSKPSDVTRDEPTVLRGTPPVHVPTATLGDCLAHGRSPGRLKTDTLPGVQIHR